MPTSLQGIANRARRDPAAVFGDLYRLLNGDNLKLCFQKLRKDAAPGVDQVTYDEYASNLDENIRVLVERLKRKSYRAKLVRRKLIPKGNGKSRSLGIPALEDKLLQRAVADILAAIHEGKFLDCSWGYRPHRSGREASRELRNALQRGRYNWVVEADIKGYFDHIDHDWLVRMLELHIKDGALTRLIKKWLKAGILEEDGKVLHPATGTPQGGILSPILANIYLHYALDLWFKEVEQRKCRGQAGMIRYADDFVCVFEHEAEARAFLKALELRLKKFGLALSEEKTRLVRFSRGGNGSGGRKSARFEFLGFAFYWGRSRKGYDVVKRGTSPSRLKRSLGNLTEWLREKRHQRQPKLMKQLNAKLRGYLNYYGVIGNSPSLNKFFHLMRRKLFKWLNRRSQRRSYNWEEFSRMCEHYGLVRPKIMEKKKQPDFFR